MKNFLMAIGLLLLSSVASASSTFDHAKQIYDRLVASNHISAPPFKYLNTDVVNAYTTADNIAITKGMLNFVQNDDELALILGHELAHYNLHHNGSTPPREYAADKLGGVYMSHSGYNLCNGAKVFDRFHDKGGRTHPNSDTRAGKLCRRFMKL